MDITEECLGSEEGRTNGHRVDMKFSENSNTK